MNNRKIVTFFLNDEERLIDNLNYLKDSNKNYKVIIFCIDHIDMEKLKNTYYNLEFLSIKDIRHIDYIEELQKNYSKEILESVLKPSFILEVLKRFRECENVLFISPNDNLHLKDYLYEMEENSKEMAILYKNNINSDVIILKNSIMNKDFLSYLEGRMRYSINEIHKDFGKDLWYNTLIASHIGKMRLIRL